MDKKEFILKTAKRASVTPKQTLEIYDAAIEIIVESLKNGDNVMLGGFGLFEPRTVPDSVSTDEETGDAKVTPSRKKVAFIATKSLNGRING